MIPVFKPLIGDAEKQAAAAALDLGWLGMGSYVAEFERALLREIPRSRRLAARRGFEHWSRRSSSWTNAGGRRAGR